MTAQAISANVVTCPHCGEKVTLFQRTYSSRLIDGKYQILDRLGVGGMGEIFKVRHIHLNELRVIKIMRPNVAADDQGLQRFLQEARTSTMMKHKNLAMLYDFAQLEDGSYYMVWEFIDGTNIQKWISQNGPVPPRLAIEISMQALNGLGKVENVSVRRDDRPDSQVDEANAPADISIQVYSQGNIVSEETGIWATLRRTIGQGAAALMWSVRMIGVAIAFLAPWALIIGALGWVARRVSRARSAKNEAGEQR